MPQPNRKRGRRMESGKKRKREEEDKEDVHGKRRKSDNEEDLKDTLSADYIPLDNGITWDQEEKVNGDVNGDGGKSGERNASFEATFFGALDDDEQEYFRNADNILEANSFADAEERTTFIANVYREAEGKELKISQSQSCSRLMERLIRLSTSSQLKRLFHEFSGNFIHLITHRFASHCCEALFIKSATVVADEVIANKNVSKKDKQAKHDDKSDDSETDVPMENMFVDILAEIEGNVGYLLTDPYASHALRVLLIVLSGEPLDAPSLKRLLQSKRKETDTTFDSEDKESRPREKSRPVPKAFSEALEQLIAESIAGLDTAQLRALATHPNGNPTLQLLLKLELTHFGKQRAKHEASIIRKLLPDDPITADSNSAAFINGLLYDPVGSHLVEKIIEHAPAKLFKTLYQEFFKERLASHARNEIAAYVACKVLLRLGHDDLLEAHELLVPHVTSLLQKNRTIVVRTLIERCSVRDIDTQAIAVQVDNTWPSPEGFEVKKLVKYDIKALIGDEKSKAKQSDADEAPIEEAEADSVKTHFNLLAQSMLLVPGSLSALVLDSLVTLDSTTLINMAKDPFVSRTLQAALTTKNASMITTRKLIQHFYGHIGEMALDKAASHVVDCIWEGTHGLAFIRERIAEELAENETALRESPCGRAVWKNWKMDLYKRRPLDWVRQSKIKASNDGFQSFSELDVNKESGTGKKTPLQLARERHARRKKSDESRSPRSTRSRKSGSGSANANTV